MADAYVIEVAGHTAGIVARDHDRDAFTFFASHHIFHALEGRRFGDPSAATRAARQLIEQNHPSGNRPKREASPQALTQ